MAAIPDGQNGASGADGRRYRNRMRSKTRLCGVCGVSWSACTCPDDDKTESVSHILASCRGLEEAHSRHLCVFVYFSYRRWSAPFLEECFSASCFPCFEGWYSAWIKPMGNPARKVTGFEDAVLEVALCFQDSTSMLGFITRVGELVVVNPAASPRHGVFLDPHVAVLQMDTMPVARMFTMAEIESGSRGYVHGSLVGENNGRKVSHIVRDDGAGGYVMQKYPQQEYGRVEFATVPQTKVKEYTPAYFEEFRWRNRRRFTKSVANSMHSYLESFIERATSADIAMRAAMHPTGELDSPEKLVQDVVSSLSGLRTILEVTPTKRTEKATARSSITIPKSAPAPPGL